MRNEHLVRRLRRMRDRMEAMGNPREAQLADQAADRIELLRNELLNIRTQTSRRKRHQDTHVRFFCPLCDDIDAALAELITDRE